MPAGWVEANRRVVVGLRAGWVGSCGRVLEEPADRHREPREHVWDGELVPVVQPLRETVAQAVHLGGLKGRVEDDHDRHTDREVVRDPGQDAAKFITGVSLPVDGGWLTQ